MEAHTCKILKLPLKTFCTCYNTCMRTLFLLLTLIHTTISPGSLNSCNFNWPKKVAKPKITKVDPIQKKCLATTIYGEARGEPYLGQVAVAYTALNRASKKTICNTVLARYQFSIFNNNSYLRAVATHMSLEPRMKNYKERIAWQRALTIAENVLQKKIPDPTHGATHYVAYGSLTSIPEWTYKLKQVAKIQNHTFFREQRHSSS